MSVELILSIAAIMVSVICVITSIISVRYCKRQTEAMEKRKFTDDPHNAYTVKLDGIKTAIYTVANKLDGKDSK